MEQIIHLRWVVLFISWNQFKFFFLPFNNCIKSLLIKYVLLERKDSFDLESVWSLICGRYKCHEEKKKSIINEQNALLCFCPISKFRILVGNLGWRLTLEKRNQIVQTLLSSSKGFYAFWWVIHSWLGVTEYSYFAQWLQNSKTAWLKLFSSVQKLLSHFFFQSPFGSDKNRMEK